MQLRALLGHLDALPTGEAGGDLDVDVRVVTRDSREAAPGVLFVAIRGANVDGHDLVGALPPGAAALVERQIAAPPGVAWARVGDARRALALAASALEGSPTSRLKVVGVTGTNGKTTTTTLIEQALTSLGIVAGRIGTVDVKLGDRVIAGTLTTPEAPQLQRWFRELADAGGSVVAIEASSIGLDQRRVDGIGFHVGVFTNLARDHLDYHHTEEAYAAAKARLFRELLRPPGGMPRALLQGDDGTWRLVDPPADRWLYGFDRGHDVRIERYDPRPDGTDLRVQTPVGTVEVRSPLVGRHNALNLTAALAAGVLLGVPLLDMAAALAHAPGAPGRLEPVGNDRGLLVAVDYAHTPDALQVAIASMRAAAPHGQVWVLFGCGGDRDRGKRPLMGSVALAADHVVVTSDNPRSESPDAIVADIVAGMGTEPPVPVHVEVDRAAAIRWVLAQATSGDAVLLAGKGHETYQEVAGVKHPFDDRDVARAALEDR